MAQVAAATNFAVNPWSAVAAASMVGKAHRFAKFTEPPAGAQDQLGFNMCGAADEPDGILYDTPLAGQPGHIETRGRLEIELGGTVAAWAEVGPDADGRAVTYPTGTGYAKILRGGVVGNVVSCIWLDRRRSGGGFATFGNAATLSRYTRVDSGTINTGFTGTLPAGIYVGQPKTITWPTDTAGTYVLTGTYVELDGTVRTTATAQDAGDLLDLIWNGTAWLVLRNSTVTMG